ncbi:hypothetical protein JL721_1604 [Aureococcus anophagefferens]|nr:hypothetical protein JL721_1604 [Aureococcus anophagefferens]
MRTSIAFYLPQAQKARRRAPPHRSLVGFHTGRAKERARAAILGEVKDGALSLAAIDALARRYETQRRDAEGRCRVALETKRQSAFLGVRALEDTARVSKDMDAKFEAVRSGSSRARAALEAFPRSELEDARVAMGNLESLLAQMDFYAAIPSRCAALRAQLEERPRDVVVVYKRTMELELWRSSLQRHVRQATDRARAADGLKRSTSDYGLEELGRLAAALAHRFAAVAGLVHDVFEFALAPLGDDVLASAADDPARRRGARVVELHETLQRQRLRRDALADAEARGEDAADALDRLRHSPTGAPARAGAVSRLYDGFRKRAATAFAEAQMSLADRGHGATAALLGAGTRLILDTQACVDHLAPLLPPSWRCARVCRSALEAHVERQLGQLWSPARARDLEVEELFQVSEWLETYNAILSEIDPAAESDDGDDGGDDDARAAAPLRPRGPAKAFATAGAFLMGEYLDRIAKQVESWFVAIRARKAEPRADPAGRLVTTRPEDMFQVITMQVGVALDHAARDAPDPADEPASPGRPKGQHVATVVLRCLEELRHDAARSSERCRECVAAVERYVRSASRGRREEDDDGGSSGSDGEAKAETRRSAYSRKGRKNSLGVPDDDAAPPSLEVERLCALANDALRVQERCEELVESLEAKDAVTGAPLLSVRAVTDQVVADYAELALDACAAAAAAPFVDLRDAIFAPDADRALFGPRWESDRTKADAVDVALTTLDDYLRDYRAWLPAYLYAKLARRAFDLFVEAYVYALLDAKPKPFADGDGAAMLLLRDQNHVLAYFLPKFTEDPDLASAGLREPGRVVAETAALRHLADVLSACAPAVDDYVVEELFADFGDAAPDVLVALLARLPAFSKKAVREDCRRAAAAAINRLPPEKQPADGGRFAVPPRIVKR